MVCNFLSRPSNKAASLWEFGCGMALAFIMAGAVVFSMTRVTSQAAGARTLQEMDTILAACRQYDVLHGAWPVSLQQLREVLPQVKMNDPWGYPYVLGADQKRAWVETRVPSGSVTRFLNGGFVVIQPFDGEDLVRSSGGRIYGQAGRLAYEKRNVYAP